jgi:thiamine pyrophosphokinase
MKNNSALIILNGKEFNKKEFLNSLSKDKLIIAVDGGIRHLEGLDIPPVIHIGDMDSSRPDTSVPVKDTLIFPAQKDNSDFHLALEYALKKKINCIFVFAAAGGRSDHFLSNYESAVRFAEKGLKITFTGKSEDIYFINKSEEFSFPVNSTVSTFSCTEITENVILKGFLYKTSGVDLYRNTPLGLSNKAVSEKQSVNFRKGILAVFLNRNKV